MKYLPIFALALAVSAQPAHARLIGSWDFEDPSNLGKATVGPDLSVVGLPPTHSASLADSGGKSLSGVITTAGGTGNHLRLIHGIDPDDSSGANINEYTLVVDLFSPIGSRSAWRSIYQTAAANNNDGDYFIRPDNDRLGVGGLGYSTGAIDDTRWTRLVIIVKNGAAGFYETHLNGSLLHNHSPQPDDERFSLGDTMLLFADDSGENAPLHIGKIALYDNAISADQAAVLGGAQDAPITATKTVTTTADELDTPALSGSGELSLREAVRDAIDGDTILFSENLSGKSIVFSTTGIVISGRSLTIDASSLPGGITIDGNGPITNNRVFWVGGSASVVTLSGLTITGGRPPTTGDFVNSRSGGAILVFGGSLRASGVTFHDNIARDGNGGAIYNFGGTVGMHNCTLTRNEAGRGGAILNDFGSVYLRHCTVVGNVADTAPNNAGGGIFSSGSSSVASLTNSIIADNFSPSRSSTFGDLGRGSNGVFTVAGVNLVGTIVDSGLTAGSRVKVGDPRLAPLSWNGGSVPTMHPLACSPAIDASSLFQFGGTDARGTGFPRLVDALADLGAVEVATGAAPAQPGDALFVDFNSNQDQGGDSGGHADPARSPAYHNQIGYQSYHANHERDAEFEPAKYSAFGTVVTLTPSWPDSTANTVKQSIDRDNQDDDPPFRDVIGDFDANWKGDKLNLLTDWIGVDTRGGNGNYDGTTGNPTRIRLTLGGLPGGKYRWRSYHHDTENVHTGFELRVSTDGGSSYTRVGTEFIGTDSTPGGRPAAPRIYDGSPDPDPADLPSTVETLFDATGAGVIFEFTPLSNTDAHRQLFAINGFEIERAEVVTSGEDLTSGGSLRFALQNTDASVITFDPFIGRKRIELESGQFSIDRSLSIDASGVPGGITIDAGGNSRVFEILSGLCVNLDSLTITGGNASGGGAISNDGTLTLSNSTVSGNFAGFDGGGIANGATLTLVNSTLSGNIADDDGGGIANDGTLTLVNSTLSGNIAGDDGGGIDNDSVVNLINSTLSGNSATDVGGGIKNDGSDVLTLANSTISGNSAASGGGIEIEGSVTLNLENSIVAENTADTGPDITRAAAAGIIINSIGVNLIGDLTDSGLSEGPGVMVTEPLLSPLGSYGGPVQTMHPLVSSPAIDAAGDTDPGGTDARGFDRFVDGALDIGAVEAGPAILVDEVADENGSTGAGDTSLREAVAAATSPGQRILFNPAVFDGQPADTITLSNGQLATGAATPDGLFLDASNITGGVTVDANGAATGHRVLEVGAGNTVALHSFTLRGGEAAAANGGGVLNDGGSLTVLNSTVAGSAAMDGGGIYNDGELSLVGSTVSGNGAANDGGGIYNKFFTGRADITNSTFSGNSAARKGGGIYCQGVIRLISSTVANNSAEDGGGGFSDPNGVVGNRYFENSIIAGNRTAFGGDIEVDDDRGGSIEIGGVILVGDLIGSSLAPGAPGVAVWPDPGLAPLANYGGQTETMPPLPFSPALDVGIVVTLLATDQRGLPRVATAGIDIGAVEIQGNSELDTVFSTAWNIDSDGDGNAFGVEQALGTNPSVFDPAHPNAFRLNTAPAGYTFVTNPAAVQGTVWRVTRSVDLVTWEEILRYDFVNGATQNARVSVSFVPPRFTFFDNEGLPNASYRFEASYEPAPAP